MTYGAFSVSAKKKSFPLIVHQDFKVFTQVHGHLIQSKFVFAEWIQSTLTAVWLQH